MEVFFLLQDSSDAYHEGQRRGLPIGVLNAPEDLFDDEHLVAREFFQPVDEPGLRHGAHARRPVPLLDAVHRATPTGRSARGAHRRGARRRQGDVVSGPPSGGRHALRRGRHARTRRLALPDVRDRHVSPAGVVPALRRRRRRDRTRCRREGTLWAFTEQLFPPKPPYAVQGADFRPYFVGYVDLGGEVIVESRIVATAGSLRIGQPVRLVTEAFTPARRRGHVRLHA